MSLSVDLLPSLSCAVLLSCAKPGQIRSRNRVLNSCVLLRRASLQGYSTSAFREKLHAFGRQDDADAVAASEKGARGLALEA